MSLFRSLFSFIKKEIDCCFKYAKLKKRFCGIKLLYIQEPISSDKTINDSEHLNQTVPELEFGKILIVVPKTFGKAYLRNLFKRRVKAIFFEEKLYEIKKKWILIASSKDASNLDFYQLKEFLIKNIRYHS